MVVSVAFCTLLLIYPTLQNPQMQTLPPQGPVGAPGGYYATPISQGPTQAGAGVPVQPQSGYVDGPPVSTPPPPDQNSPDFYALVPMLMQRVNLIEMYLRKFLNLNEYFYKSIADIKAYVGTSTHICNHRSFLGIGPQDNDAVVSYDQTLQSKFSSNIAPSFDLRTGCFVAGADGVYLISASGHCEAQSNIEVSLLKNDKVVEKSFIFSSKSVENGLPRTEQCAAVRTMQLRRGDVVKLKFNSAGDGDLGKVRMLNVCVNLLHVLPDLLYAL